MTQNDDVKSRLMQAGGRRVKFKYPGTEGRREGRITDRVAVAGSALRGVPYYDVVDFIAFDGEPEPWIRLTYYRHLPDGRLIFAGQYSICEPISVWGRILAAAREKEWFRKL